MWQEDVLERNFQRTKQISKPCKLLQLHPGPPSQVKLIGRQLLYCWHTAEAFLTHVLRTFGPQHQTKVSVVKRL